MAGNTENQPCRGSAVAERRPVSWSDLLGIVASGACLVHCLLLPLILALAPALAATLGLPEELHAVAFCVAVPATSWAMVRGYRLHGTANPAVLGVFGLAGLALGFLGGFDLLAETCFTVSGSILLTIAHLRNWRLRTRSTAA